MPSARVPLRFARIPLSVAALTIAAVSLGVSDARAQSAQPYSVQLAVLFTSFKNGSSSSIGGTGVEPQFRLNRLYSTEEFGALSLGIGGQYTSHSSGGQTLTITGVFLEPRWVPAIRSSYVAPYLSGRLAFLHQSNNFGSSSSGNGFGAGGGLAIKMTKTTNLDAGVQLVRQTFGDIRLAAGNASRTFQPFTTYAAKVGISLGFPR